MIIDKNKFVACLGDIYGTALPAVIDTDLPHVRKYFASCVYVSDARLVTYKGKSYIINGRLHIYPEKGGHDYKDLDGLNMLYDGAKCGVSYIKELSGGGLLFEFGHKLAPSPCFVPAGEAYDKETTALMDDNFMIRKKDFDPTPWL